MSESGDQNNKAHRPRQAGNKARKKKAKDLKKKGVDVQEQKKNPKVRQLCLFLQPFDFRSIFQAFGVRSTVRARIQSQRTLDLETSKLHLPIPNRIDPDNPPPFMVLKFYYLPFLADMLFLFAGRRCRPSWSW
jgi:hypothetical protein